MNNRQPEHFLPTASVPRQCVILVGGVGSRLGGEVKRIPKPMLEIAGVPFLRHLMRELARFGFSRFLLLAGYRAEVVKKHFADNGFNEVSNAVVNVLVENEPMGTGGALRFAAPRLDSSFLLCNGDSLCMSDVDSLCLPLDDSILLRMALRQIPENTRYGAVETDGDRVIGFLPRSESGRAGLMNAGLYHMRREIVRYIPEGTVSLEDEVFPALARQRAIAFHDAGNGYFIDIGVPGDLERARRELPAVLNY